MLTRDQYYTPHLGTPTALELGPFTAYVEVNGKKVKCYAIDTNEYEKKVTCYIASEEGKKVSFSLGKRETEYHCMVQGFIDGMNAGWIPIKKEHKSSQCAKYASIHTRTASKRPFVFGKIPTIDDSAAIDSHLLSSNYGHESYFGQIKMVVKSASGEVWNDNRNVFESSDKARDVSHQVLLGESLPCLTNHTLPKEKRLTFKNVHSTVATFIFIYRPIENLRTLRFTPLQEPRYRSQMVPMPVAIPEPPKRPHKWASLNRSTDYATRAPTSSHLAHTLLKVEEPPKPKLETVEDSKMPNMQIPTTTPMTDKNVSMLLSTAEYGIWSREEKRLLVELERVRSKKRQLEIKDKDVRKRFRAEPDADVDFS